MKQYFSAVGITILFSIICNLDASRRQHKRSRTGNLVDQWESHRARAREVKTSGWSTNLSTDVAGIASAHAAHQSRAQQTFPSSGISREDFIKCINARVSIADRLRVRAETSPESQLRLLEEILASKRGRQEESTSVAVGPRPRRLSYIVVGNEEVGELPGFETPEQPEELGGFDGYFDTFEMELPYAPIQPMQESRLPGSPGTSSEMPLFLGAIEYHSGLALQNSHTPPPSSSDTEFESDDYPDILCEDSDGDEVSAETGQDGETAQEDSDGWGTLLFGLLSQVSGAGSRLLAAILPTSDSTESVPASGLPGLTRRRGQDEEGGSQDS
ncbi:hypothetical protein ACFLX2_00540 [Candidatus Dependentiae bacterium]